VKLTPLRIKTRSQDVVIDSPGTLLLGRGPAVDIACDDPRVSRHHAAIRWSDTGWVLEDLGSRNGTFVSGQRIARIVVAAPTRILLGDANTGVAVDLTPQLAAPSRADPGLDRPVDLGRLSNLHSTDALGTRITIGRAPDNTIVLDDLHVSRHHAELRGDARVGYRLVDVGSYNGTFLNGERVAEAAVADSDIVTIGRHSFCLVDGTLQEYVDTGEVALDVINLTVRAGASRTLLDSVSFALGPRSLLAVVGPSGAGKSTLLNALSGFRPADDGAVLYGGRNLYAAYDELRRRIGFVPQDDIIHTQLPLRMALEFTAKLRFPPDVTHKQRSDRVYEVMEELGLSDRAELVIDKLSGGQRKRASIAVELLTKPSLLFLDEPTSGLDPGYEKAVMTLLRELADGGRTLVVVTHTLQSIALCDRLLFLAPGGEVAFFGPAKEALAFFGKSDPADIFTDLERRRDLDWASQYRQTAAYEMYVRRPLAMRKVLEPTARSDPRPERIRHTAFRQFRTLSSRYLAVLASDRRNLALLLLQAPVIALLMLTALGQGALDVTPGGPGRLGSGETAVTLLAIGITLMGMLNALREIVKELPIYRRERSVGLSIPAYVASKFAVLAPLTVAQAAVLVLIGTSRQHVISSGSALGSVQLELIIDLALTGIAAMSLGLLVSALVKSADKAVTILVVLAVGQLVLSNPGLNIGGQPVLAQLSWATSATWGFGAVASSVDLRHVGLPLVHAAHRAAPFATPDPSDATCKQVDMGQQVAADPRVDAFDQAYCKHGNWAHLPVEWVANVGILLVLTALTLAATCVVLRRRDPTLLSGGARAAGWSSATVD
jgi:ABC-type multidrug transport system ATPase subunit/pSer/pThr/pTyr-binding forkhead associated (FHA) protein